MEEEGVEKLSSHPLYRLIFLLKLEWLRTFFETLTI
jgi:hypothetical protein